MQPMEKATGAVIIKNTQQDIPLCRFQKKLQIIPCKNDHQDQGNQGDCAIAQAPMITSMTELKSAKLMAGSSEFIIHA